MMTRSDNATIISHFEIVASYNTATTSPLFTEGVSG
jgi:hypothetical protein